MARRKSDLQRFVRVQAGCHQSEYVGLLQKVNVHGVLEVFCDADHAGDLGSRMSRFGMSVTWRRLLIKNGSEVHSTIALSRGESEWCIFLRSSTHALGIGAMLDV